MNEREKFEKLIEGLGITPFQFSRALGFDRPDGLYKILNGKTLNPGISIYIKIKEVYPQVRYEFLIDGKMPVFEDEKHGPELGDVLSELNELRQEASLKDAIIKKLVGKIEVSLLSPEQYKRMNQKHQGISVFAKAHGLSGVRPRQAFFVVKR